MKRLKYIDGIKGIACFCVFAHHFLLAFYPAYFKGEPSESHFSSQIDVHMAQSPLSFIVNGQFWVCVFILVSAFLTAKQVFYNDDMERILGSIWKRYFRLMLPMLVIGIITWAMDHCGLFINLEVAQVTGSWWLGSYFGEPLDFQKMLYVVLYASWFGDVSNTVLVSHAFWMMSYLFIGYFVAMLLTIVVKHTSKWSYIILVGAAYLAFCGEHYYYLAVIAGVGLADISRTICVEKTQKWYHHVICIIILLIGVYLGGYPSGMVPTNHYSRLPYFLEVNTCVIYHILAAVLVFSVLLYWEPFQKLCGLKPFCMLGMLCYGVFLMQTPIEFSLTLKVFQDTLNMGSGYHMAVCVSFIITTITLLISVWIFHILVEKNCEKVLNMVQNRLLKKRVVNLE